MRATDQTGSTVLVLLVVLSAAAVAAIALSGTAAAQQGDNVTLQDPIPEDSAEFYVNITELNVSGDTGCLEVENEDVERTTPTPGGSVVTKPVSEGDTVIVDVDDIGGIEGGDVVNATLYETYDGRCFGQQLDFDTTTVTEAAFVVEIDETNSPVIEGDTLEVDATVENTGAQAGLQEIALTIDGDRKDSVTLDLEGGTSYQWTLTWETETGDAGEHTAVVTSEDDEDFTGVRVDEPATFAVEIDKTNSPVTEGDTLEVDATVVNDDDHPDTQEIDLTIDGTRTDSRTLSLDAGESETVTLTWETEAGDAGEYPAEVASETGSDTTVVSVEEAAEFAVEIDETNSPIVHGDTLEVDAIVENVGGLPATQEIDLTIDGTQTDSRTLFLDGGESETVTLTWETEASDAGEYTAEVASENDSDTATVFVTAGGGGNDDDEQSENATFEVRIDDVRIPGTDGDPFEVDATIENTGNASDTQTVSMAVNGVERDSQEVTLGVGESLSTTFRWNEPDDADEHNVQVASEDDVDESSVGGGISAGGVFLLLLILLLLLAYYYVRRRQQEREQPRGSGDDA